MSERAQRALKRDLLRMSVMWCARCELYIKGGCTRWQGRSWHYDCLQEEKVEIAQGDDSESD